MKCRKWFRSAVACALAAGLVAGLGGCETETPLSSAGAESGAESAAAIKLKYTPPISIDQAIYNIGMCVTDLGSQSVSKETFAKRCQLYKDFGLVTIRTGTLWGDVERKEGEFLPPTDQQHLYRIRENGMRIKLILGAVSVIPDWYLAQYPDAMMVNEEGGKAISSVTYLIPGLQEKIEAGIDYILSFYKQSGLLDLVDSIVVDLGTSGEPIYPPAWTQTPNGLYEPSGPEHFWMYDPYMQADFKKVMQEKYGTIEAANEAWGQNYPSFETLEVPKPGTVKGTMWRDVLTWYRDVKREFIDQNVQTYKRVVEKYAGDRIKLILYLPGRDVRDSQFEEAVASGEGNDMVKLMADSRFIIDTAVKYGCWLQCTGAEDETELRYIKSYMKEIGCEDIPLFGENSGGYNVGADMKRFIDKQMRNGLAGVDITHDQWLHEDDGYSPNKYYDKIKENLLLFSTYLKAGMR